MILLSLALVVASAATLAIGVVTTSDALVWTSLGAGLGAVALVAGSVSRRRPAALPDTAGPTTVGAVAVGPASTGVDPAPSRAVPVAPPGPAPGARAVPSEVAGPVSPGPAPDSPGHSSVRYPAAGSEPGGPGVQDPAAGAERSAGDPGGRGDSAPPTRWGTGDGSPWTAVPPPPRSAGSRYGWTGAVPAVSPPPAAAGAQPINPPPAGSGTRPGSGPPAFAAPGSGPPAAAGPAAAGPASGAPARPAPAPPGEAEAEAEEGVEVLPVRDALRVAQLADEVLVVDGQPRYHLTGCELLAGTEPMPLAVSAARRGGFTPCAVCAPDRALLDRSRSRAIERSNEGRSRSAADGPGPD